MSAKIAAQQHSKSRRPNPGHSTAAGLAAQTINVNNPSKEHYYEFLLETCERLFDNEVEQHAFEDQMRAVFGIQVRILGHSYAYLTRCLRYFWSRTLTEFSLWIK